MPRNFSNSRFKSSYHATARIPKFSDTTAGVYYVATKIKHLQFGAHRGALGHLTSETRAATMAAGHEHQDELPQGSPIEHQEASTSEAISQITNLTRLVEELTKKHNDQQSHMETITAENQILKNQLMAINSQAAYSYYYNPYVGYSSGASAGGWLPAASYEQRGTNDGTWRPATSYNPQGANAGGWQHATPYHQQRSRATYSSINPMQPLFASEDTPVVDERQAQPRQTAPGPSSRRQTTPIRRSTPELSQSSEDLFQPGTNVEEMMRSIMSEEMRTLEAQMQQRFTSQIHKATTSTPGIDDLARGVRETPLTKRITNTITPKFSNISFPQFDGMDHMNRYALTLSVLAKRFRRSRGWMTAQRGKHALHRAKGFIELEEENERVERDLARTREELSKARDEREKNF
ncbi:hypothetical protein TIFTF001_042294, partial [Ficus carica]